jgi:AcrR family transcriptional regulator
VPAPNNPRQPVISPLPRGPHAISAEAIAADQRRRLLAALPRVVAEHGFEGTTVEHIVKLAQVRRNSFYEQFSDKHECFAEAYEIAQERLLGVLTFHCYTRRGLESRIGSALEAGLGLLGADPVLAHLLVVEAPAAGDEVAARHHQWLDRYGRMLQLAAVDRPGVEKLSPALEPAVVGGLVSRVKQLVLAGEAAELPGLLPELLRFTLSFYGSPEDGSPRAVHCRGAESAQPQSPERRSILEPV